MSSPKTSPAIGADWTQLLTDPDLVRHLGKLLQIYRDAPPDKRDQTLRDALREIKSNAGKTADIPAATPAATAAAKPAAAPAAAPEAVPDPVPVTTAPEASPPFEPDIFTPSWGQDRRRYPRMKCFVAVELHLAGSETPIWGNLSNTSLGGCFVETASPVPTGVEVELGLWVANGKIWVKGIILNGIVIKSNPCFGVRIKFGQMESAERESLREFLKFVEGTTKGYQSHHGYLAHLKR
jgi:hypothetical protein